MSDTLTDVIGYLAGSMVVLLTMPQIIKVLKTKKAEDLSILTVIIFITASTLWIIYGVRIDSLPLIVMDAISAFLGICLLILKIYFDKIRKRKKKNKSKNIKMEQVQKSIIV